MPFHWIESILAISFTLVWIFIGMTLLGDRLSEVRQRRSSIQSELLGPHSSARHEKSRGKSLRRRRRKQRGTSVDRMAV